MAPKFEGGGNIAMKVPSHQYVETVAFYRDVLKLKQVRRSSENSCCFQFGSIILWIDNAPTIDKSEIWLEIVTDSTLDAAEVFAQAGVNRCDEIEELDGGFDGFWIKNPASIVHLIDSEAKAVN